jgi:hypothetical protein
MSEKTKNSENNDILQFYPYPLFQYLLSQYLPPEGFKLDESLAVEWKGKISDYRKITLPYNFAFMQKYQELFKGKKIQLNRHSPEFLEEMESSFRKREKERLSSNGEKSIEDSVKNCMKIFNPLGQVEIDASQKVMRVIGSWDDILLTPKNFSNAVVSNVEITISF